MRIVFFGSDDFAAVHLAGLLGKHELLGVVTGPDRPQGRGMKIAISPIKQIALDHQIPCLQPETLKDPTIVDKLDSFGADIFVVVAYGRLLTQEILDIPRMLCVNVHGSLLPRYRGAAPVNWAILNGEKETGVSIQKMVLKLDAGQIIAQHAMAIGPEENAQQLRERMAQAGAKLLLETLWAYPDGGFPLRDQDESAVSIAPKLTKEMGKIDWQQTARAIHTQLRGLQPWPGAYTFYHEKMLKIIQVELLAEGHQALPGEVIRADKNGIYVACRDQVLLIKEVQPQAGRPMTAAGFVAGYKITPGFVFA